MRARLAAFGVALTLLLAVSSVASAAVCNGRPTDAGGYQGYTYGAAEVKAYDTAQVRVHYATSGPHQPALASTRADGVPDTVAFAGDTAEDALTRYAQMGFKMPLSDAACPSNGGDGRLDIYLVTFAGADGTTVPEACNGRACSSFVLSESQFVGRGYADAQEGFKTVVTHELFHTVQNVYDSQLDRFWAEGTAQWAMKTLHPELQDFERQLPAFFGNTTQSLDSAPAGVTSGFLYGSAVWPLFLTLTEGPDFVRLVLEGEADGTKAIDATDAVLKTKGSSMADAFPLFAAWNAATKSYAGTGGYPDAASYPGVKVAALADGAQAITSGLSYYAYKGTLDGSKQISLDTDEARNGGMVIPLEGGKAQLDHAAKLPANAEGDVLVVVAGVTSKKTDAPFTIHIGDPAPSSGGSSGGGGGDGGGGGGCAIGAARSGPSGASRPNTGDTSAFAAAVAAALVLSARRARTRR